MSWRLLAYGVALCAGCPAFATQDVLAPAPDYAIITMQADTSFLSPEERRVAVLLMRACDQMTAIFRRQARASDGPDGPGHGLYPAGLTKAALETYLAAHSSHRAALMDGLTVVRRQGRRFVAIPYAQAYRGELTQAAALLRQAAAITTNPSLRRFLRLRADAFLSNDYFASEMAWLDIKDTPLSIGIGPSGTSLDGLLATKMVFRASLSLRNPVESAALDRYKSYLTAMEANLPVEPRYKNFKRGMTSPISVEQQIWHGGAATVGPQGIAYNAPDDERIREAKGAKKGVLSNVLDAKYDAILRPMAIRVLVADQADRVNKRYFSTWTLFHELSHSLGPGSIAISGRHTTVMAEMKDIGVTSEEAKADVMGVYNVEFMMDMGELPRADKAQLLATYFVDLFRILRFGADEAHGRGAALQYGYLRARRAFNWDADQKRFRIDNAKMQTGLRDLVADIVVRQGNGDYAGMQALFKQYARLDTPADSVIGTLKDIPTDITAVYLQPF